MTAAVGDYQFALAGLLGLNGVFYSLLVLAVIKRRRGREVRVTNVADAFRAFEGALKNAGVGLPPGFTWEEAIAYLRGRGLQVDRIQDVLSSYEAYRYGGKPLPDADFKEVLRLTNRLGGMKIGH